MRMLFLLLSLALFSNMALANQYQPYDEEADCYHKLLFSGESSDGSPYGNPIYVLESFPGGDTLEEDIAIGFKRLISVTDLKCTPEEQASLIQALDSIECLRRGDTPYYCDFYHEKYGLFQVMKDYKTSMRFLYLVLSHND